jgi:hypothetical protein
VQQRLREHTLQKNSPAARSEKAAAKHHPEASKNPNKLTEICNLFGFFILSKKLKNWTGYFLA